MIPKIFHACWFGRNPMPESAHKYIESWKKYNPDYEVMIWTEENFDVSCNLYVKEAYDNKKFAFVTDYVRLKVLYEYGGIYIDTDVEVIKPMDFFLDLPAFSGFEGPNRIPTGTMGAEKGNRWIGLLLKDYDNKHFVLPDGSFDITTNVKLITDTTVANYPIKLNNTLQRFDDFTMFPFDYLCAKDLVDLSIKKTENTYTIHHFSGSWTTPRKKLVKKLIEIFGYSAIKKAVEIKHMLQRGFKK